MGFPLQNNYTLLRALAFGSNSRYAKSNKNIAIDREEYKAISESLERFRLFAFVVHDPDKEKAFHNNLSAIFERLDHTTGQSLLFFALADPPEKWHTKAAQREYYKQLSGIQFRQEGDLFGNPIDTINKTETPYTIAQALQIPAEALPVIVVTNDLRNSDFRWFATSEHTIERQLNELGFMAYDCPEVRSNWRLAESLFDKYQENFDLYHASDAQKTTTSLAKALSDALSFMVVVGRSTESEYQKAIVQAKNTMRDLHRVLIQMKEANETSRYSIADTELFEQINLNIVNYLGILNTESTSKSDDILPIEKRFLEPDAFHMLVTARKVLDLFDRQDTTVRNIMGESSNYDYTAVGICLTKLFEKEINLSLVHWIRKELGVDLPDCFNKVDRRLKYATYTPTLKELNDPRTIHFNKGRNGTERWLPPGIGESKLCFASMLADPSYSKNLDVFTAPEAKTIITKWQKIAELRNACAHTDLISRGVVEQIIQLLKELNSIALFEKAYELKQLYRN